MLGIILLNCLMRVPPALSSLTVVWFCCSGVILLYCIVCYDDVSGVHSKRLLSPIVSYEVSGVQSKHFITFCLCSKVSVVAC